MKKKKFIEFINANLAKYSKLEMKKYSDNINLIA